MPSENLQKAKEHLASLEAFRWSPAHVAWVISRKQDLQEINDNILSFDPVDRSGEIEQFKLRGEKRYVEGMLSYFDRAIEEVKDEIANLEDEEQGMNAESPNEDSLVLG